jgi:hypothetical protein
VPIVLSVPIDGRGKTMKILKAENGWNIVSRDPSGIHYREPVLGWHMVPTGEPGKLIVFPVTVNGIESNRDVILERPDSSIVKPDGIK